RGNFPPCTRSKRQSTMPVASSVLPDSTTLPPTHRFRRLARSFVAVIALLSCATAARAQGRIAGVLAFNEDAYISYDSGLKQWSVGTRAMQLQIGFSKSGALTLLKFWNPDINRDWSISAEPEVGVTLAGEALTLQEAGTRTRFLQATAITTETGVALNL